MPDMKDHDIERIDPTERNIDPYWDGLISNPDLREAFNEAKERGHETQEAHVVARLEVFGEEQARDQFGDDAVDAVQGAE